jgi:signal transduction histidine kinase
MAIHSFGPAAEPENEIDGMNHSGAFGGGRVEVLDARDHELRSALCGIEAVAECLISQHERITTREQRELTSALAAEARRLRTMLDPREEAPTTFDLADAIRPAIVAAQAAGLGVHHSVPSGILVQGRYDHTAQVLVALLDNARHHASMSAVEIRVTSHEPMTNLFVEDRGPGLAAHQRERVFERGVGVARTSRTGLGLFVARRLMEAQGGSLTASPRAGGGTSFVLGFRTAASTRSERVGAVRSFAAIA